MKQLLLVGLVACLLNTTSVCAEDMGSGIKVGNDMIVKGDGNSSITIVTGQLHNQQLDQSVIQQLVELGITKSALNGFLKALKEQNVPAQDLNNKLLEIANDYKAVKAKLNSLSLSSVESQELRNKATLALQNNDYELAKGFLRKADELRVEEDAEIKAALGDLEMLTFNYEEAANYYSSAAELLSKYEGSFATQLGQYLYNSGRAYQEVANFKDAERVLKKCVAVRKKINLPNVLELVKTLNNLGNNYLETQQYKDALNTYNEALQIVEKHQLWSESYILAVYNNVGLYFFNKKDTKMAEYYYKKALSLKTVYLAPLNKDGFISLAAIETNLGDLYLSKNKKSEAGKHYDNSLYILKNSLGESNDFYSYVLNKKANIENSFGGKKLRKAIGKKNIKGVAVNNDLKNSKMYKLIKDRNSGVGTLLYSKKNNPKATIDDASTSAVSLWSWISTGAAASHVYRGHVLKRKAQKRK